MSWKGEPGPFFEATEQKQVHRLLSEIRDTLETAQRFPAPDGENHKILVDVYLLCSAGSVLEHYEALLAKMPELPYGSTMISGLILADAISKTDNVDQPEEVIIRTYESCLDKLKSSVDQCEALIREFERRLAALKNGEMPV